jgi:hypothetical protein
VFEDDKSFHPPLPPTSVALLDLRLQERTIGDLILLRDVKEIHAAFILFYFIEHYYCAK